GGVVRLIARHERAGVARTELALETEIALDVAVPAVVQARPVSERERRPLFARLSHSRAALPQRKLGRTDMLVTEIALGGVGLGGRRTTNDDAIAAETVRRAWARG